jgi:hypothetical protein
MEQFCTNLNEKLNSEEIKNKKRFHKAINLIDDFVTKFISKIEYYKMTLESQINKAKFTLINTPLSSDIKTNEKKEDNEKVKDDKININEDKSKEEEKEKEKDNIKNNDEFLNKFMNTKNFYKKALYLLYLITEDKSQIQKIIEKDEDNCLKKKNETNFSCVKEINTKIFINSITFLRKENLFALGMYNFFDGSSIDLYTLDLKIKLSIKKLGSNIYELQSGELVTCSYNSINIIKLETNNNQNMKYKIIQSLQGKKDSGEILGVIELDSVLISYDWNHILIWKKSFQNTKSKKKKENSQIIKFKEYKSSNFGSDFLIKINNDDEFISHHKGNAIVFNSLQNFDNENKIILKNLHSVGDSMCLIDNNRFLIIGGNENGLIYIISIEKKEIITSIKISDINNYSINRISFYKINDEMNILCAGGYNVSEKDVISDIINISFNINNDSKQVFNIEKQNIIKNAHNSWITGLLIENNFIDNEEEKNKFYSLIDNSYVQSNLLNDDIIFFSTSHDKKFKIWKSNNNSLI